MTRPFGFAIVGVGLAATPHILALKSLSDRVEIHGVYARSKDAREAFAAEHQVAASDSLDALVDNPNVDAALILTPPNVREDVIEPFAAAGKHILCEKPLERTTQAAERVVKLCEDANVALGIVFQTRYRPAALKLKAMVDNGALGAVQAVRIALPWWRDQDYYDTAGRGTYARDGGGVLISQAIHTLDLAMHLVGPVAEVRTLATTTAAHNMESEDFVAGALRFGSGVPGSLLATTMAYPGGRESITLDCSLGTAVLEANDLRIYWRDGREEISGDTTGSGGGADPMAFPFDWHRALILDYVDAVSNGKLPPINAEDALRAQRLIDACLTSSNEGRAIQL